MIQENTHVAIHHPISHSVGDVYFNYRVCGVVVHEDRILIVKISPYEFWLLPGGRVEYLETSKEALQREILEELGVSCEIGTLRWVVEDLYPFEGEQTHELCFYYNIAFPSDSQIVHHTVPWTVEEPAKECESAKTLTFYWLPLKELSSTSLIPSYIKDHLSKPANIINHFTVDGL